MALIAFVIPLLETEFHVVCVSYDGFDETEQTVFHDMLTEAEKMEQYILKQFYSDLVTPL